MADPCGREGRRRRRRSRLAFGFVLLPLIAGCGVREPSEPLAWRLDDGRTPAAWVEGREAAAVLVMDPDDCLVCYTVLGPWLKERARH